MAPVFDVVVLGSANLDLVVRTERHPRPGETVLGSTYNEFPGGKGLNQAVAAARSGATTALVGAVGHDEAGVRLRAVAATDGIDTQSLRVVDDVPTGRALITVASDGDNSIVVVPGANSHVQTHVPECRVLVAQLEIPHSVVTAAFSTARARGAITVLNPAPAAPLPTELLTLTDVIVPNEHEVDLIGGVTALRDAGISSIVVTLGSRGVRIISEHGIIERPAIAADVVDTTGAGDAFCGGLAARLAAGDGLPDAVQWGIAAGSLATTMDGAVPSLPTASAIVRLLSAASAT